VNHPPATTVVDLTTAQTVAHVDAAIQEIRAMRQERPRGPAPTQRIR
jgi:hypothetical protein